MEGMSHQGASNGKTLPADTQGHVRRAPMKSGFRHTVSGVPKANHYISC
jgi:hypothetical protein